MDYIVTYQNLNKQFEVVIEETLRSESADLHKEANSFYHDFEEWLNLLNNQYEIVLYKEAASEYKAMLLFWCMGLYKHAFISLRSYFEATLFGIQLSSNELNFRLWKMEQLDLYWSGITDPDNGIFSSNFVKAFNPTLCDDRLNMLTMAKGAYRECSEFIHNNYGATSGLPEDIRFDDAIHKRLAQKVAEINKVITYLFVVRYYDLIKSTSQIDIVEDSIMDQLNGYRSVQRLFGTSIE